MYMHELRACCSSTGKWYLRWDPRIALSSSSSSCCRIRSYPWHSSRDIAADAIGVRASPPRNTVAAPHGLASATVCTYPQKRSIFANNKMSLIVHFLLLFPHSLPLSLLFSLFP